MGGRWRAAAGLVVAGATLAAVPAPAGAEPAAKVVPQTPDAIRDYWTAERMREAEPISEAIDGSSAVLGGALTDPQAKRGGPNAVPLRHRKRVPKRTHGKVYFTLRDVLGQPRNFVCSGTVVRAPNDSLVITAGHCVYGCDDSADGIVNGACEPARATNFNFVPAFKNGDKPFGEWPAEGGGVRATPQYENNENLGYDVGAADIASRNGRDVEDVVGGRGIAFNERRDQFYKAFGYPASGIFVGNQAPYVCRSPYYGRDEAVDPPAIRISCDMTGGASGGGWIIDGGDVASVTSYNYPTNSQRLYGPYFGSAIKSFYESVKND